MDQGSGVASVGRLNQPPLNDCPDVELESLGHGVKDDHLVLRNCTEMQGRLNFNTEKMVPNLTYGREVLHLKGGELVGRWMALPHALAPSELLH